MTGSTPAGIPVVLVCPTSHLDWDWLDTFAEYFAIGPPGTVTPGYSGAVSVLFDGACELLSDPSFSFSLAEAGYLQAYLAASPDRLAVLLAAGPDRFVLMGGGITSPDNLVCHGEVFIRNYLIGRRWLNYFVTTCDTGWPVVGGEPLVFATAGGDFAFSQWDVGGNQGNWLTVTGAYPGAQIGTFPRFMTQAAGAAGQARAPLLAQNYWTGYFASRPRLKILHYRAAQRAMAAEVAAALLRVASSYSTSALDDLDAAIDEAWQVLVPSSHHDYITGTAPDRVYWSEQLPKLELADRLAQACLTRATGLIAAAVTFGSEPGGGRPVVVFNPLGFARGGVVHLSAHVVTGSFGSVAGSGAPVQRAADGGLLFRVPGQVGSFGYITVTLMPGEPVPNSIPAPSDTVTMTNGLVTATLDRSKGWAITSLAVGASDEGTELLPPNGLGNSIRLYDDQGNLYQFGNEPLEQDAPGTFTDSGTTLVGDAGEWIETGPQRWHFRAFLTGTYGQPPDSQPVSYTLDYLLYAGEPVLRMRLTGAAPPATSVLTAFDLAAPGPAGYGLTYGTAHHWDDNQPVPYWTGPTFRATHDFAQATGTTGPELAIYHQSVPAWCTLTSDSTGASGSGASGSTGLLLGALLRNTDGTDRGAAGTDPGVHALEYAVGSAGLSPVDTGDALRTALAVTNALVPAVPGINRPAQGVSLPPDASLATISQPGILRVARTQPGSSAVVIASQSGNYYAERKSFVLRAYLPASFQAEAVISLPDLPDPDLPGYDPDLAAVVVSALEEPVNDGPPVTVSGDTVSFTPQQALSTVQLTITRWPTLPDNGKTTLPDNGKTTLTDNGKPSLGYAEGEWIA